MQKIMFNDKYGLTQAVLEGRKTMTRRICFNKATKEPILANDVQSYLFYPDENILEFVMNDGSIKVAVPQLKVSEVVAVAQSYDTILAEHKGRDGIGVWAKVVANRDNNCAGDTNKMFVKPNLMPHHIRITDIRIEKLRDITDEDCLKEGIIAGEQEPRMFGFRLPKGTILSFLTPRAAFAALIDKVSKKGTWESNPYVFVYEFKLID